MSWGRYMLSTSVRQELVHEQPALPPSCAFLPRSQTAPRNVHNWFLQVGMTTSLLLGRQTPTHPKVPKYLIVWRPFCYVS